MVTDYEAFFDSVGFDEEERQIALNYIRELFGLIILDLNTDTEDDWL